MSSGNDAAREILEAFAGYTDAPASGGESSATRTLRLGTVTSGYSGSGAASVIFDGETVAGARTYLPLTPVAASARVVLMPVGSTYVIAGSVAADSGWIAVGTFENGWVNYGAPVMDAAYRKIGNRVFLRGTVKSGTIGTTIFALPAGYRPVGYESYAVTSNSAFGTVTIPPSGSVVAEVGSNAFIYLSGVSFATD